MTMRFRTPTGRNQSRGRGLIAALITVLMGLGLSGLTAAPSQAVSTDTDAPTTTDNVPTAPGEASQSPFAVTLTSDDHGGSGVAHIYYEIGTQSAPKPTPTTSSPVYNPSQRPLLEPEHYITYFAVDNAGNVEPVKTSALWRMRSRPELNYSPWDDAARPREVATADLDGDGIPEIVAATQSQSVVILHRTATNPTYSATIAGGTGADPNQVVIADLDGDGDKDIATPNFSGGDLTLLTRSGPGLGSYTTSSVSSGGIQPIALKAADLNGDGSPELIVANAGSDNVVVLSNASGSWTPAQTLSTGRMPVRIEAADLDGDGDLDLAVPCFRQAEVNDQNISIFTNAGNGSFSSSTTSSGGPSARSMSAVDLDGDHNLELVVSDFSANTVTVLKRGTSNTYSIITTLAVGSQATETAEGDFDADGDLDILATAAGSSQVYYFDNNGDATFSSPEILSSPTTPRSIVVADLDGDSDVDAAVANLDSSVGVFTNQRINTPPDTTAPTTTDDLSAAASTEPVEVTLTATDGSDGSGVWRIFYTIGNGSTPASDPLGTGGVIYGPGSKPTLYDGQYLRYAAVDVAGNAETPHDSATAHVVATVSTPTITGTATPGSTLTATATATPTGATLAYQWLRLPATGTTTTPIAGATSSTYAVTTADAGSRLAVQVSAGAPGYATATSPISPVVIVVVNNPPIPAGYTVKATGGDQVGETRTAQSSLDGDSSITLSYQWQKADGKGGWANLPGAAAKKRAYLLPPAVMNVNIRAQITATRGTSVVVKATAPLVIRAGDQAASNPRIIGDLEAGGKVTAVVDDEDKPDGLEMTYSWTIGGNEIKASGRTITLPKNSAGKKIICDIRLTAPGYYNQQLRTPAKTIKK